MSYIFNTKNRKLKAKLNNFIKLFRFKVFYTSTESKIALIWIFISTFSLFIPWVMINESWFSSFSMKIGHIGFVFLLINLIIWFISISNSKKENIKLQMAISFRDHSVLIITSIIALLLTYISVNLIKAYSVYSTWIIVWEGIIYSVIGYIFTLVWGILMYKSYKQEISEIIVENASGEEEYKEIDKSNMQLPF